MDARILNDSQIIDGYTVNFLIKKSQYNESYCVTNSSGEKFFLKIYSLKSVPSSILNSDSIITEIDYCEKLNHPNVINFVEKGVYSSDDNYPYLVTRFIEGNMVSEPLSKGRIFPTEMALSITKSILKGIAHMHSLGLIHNDITPRNILYNSKDLNSTTLIDLGHTSSITSKKIAFNASELTPFYRAPETYNNVFDTRSDIYSIAAVLYAMLFGKAPWYSSHVEEDEFCYALIKDIMCDRLSFSGGVDKCPSWLQSILKMCLSLDPNNRIQSAADFLDAIENESCPQIESSVAKTDCAKSEVVAKDNTYTLSQKEGNGFADVAGMDNIKAMLQQKVLFLLKNPEKAQKYKLLPPNGMLLYGPTGCGKTFFAEKFAEHQAKSREGATAKFKGGLASTGEMETKYHTATHLLNAALRVVLGSHVHQRGSNITAERMRFDFSHPAKMTDEEKQKTEDLVNEWIQAAIPVEHVEMKKEEAIAQGAEAMFIEKYGDIVSVYKIGDVSLELCGGPHVENTSELGEFKIKKEESSSSGVRRIKAILQ